MGKTLYFEGAGYSGAEISKATVGNCRIRTAFHLDNGKAVYLEISAFERPDAKKRHGVDLFDRWQYTGVIEYLHYITDDEPNDDCNRHRVRDLSAKEHDRLEYSERSICNLVNSLGASFDAIKVVPDLGGYRVFPEKNSCKGTKGYFYGDQFELEPELVEKREQVYKYFYHLERSEGKKYPNFSLWVDEEDKNVLHLLRHFSGTFKTAHNTHWIIRIDEKDVENGRSWTMKEAVLGKCGC